MGLFQPLFKHFFPLRLAWALGWFLLCLPFSIVFTSLNYMDGMLGLWTVYTKAMGMTMRVHGEKPPLDKPALWLANHLCVPGSRALCLCARPPRRRRPAGARSLSARDAATGSTGPCCRPPRRGLSACTQ